MRKESRALCNHVAKSIEVAEKESSGISPHALAVPGFTGTWMRHLLNALCSREGTCYLEVGLHRGATFFSALSNNRIKATGVDMWLPYPSEEDEEDIRSDFWDRFPDLCGDNDIKIIEHDFFQLGSSLNGIGPVTVFFYDGDHSELCQRLALQPAWDELAPCFVFLVDDFQWDYVRRGTLAGIKDMPVKALFSQELKPRHEGDSGTWWNGVYVTVLEKR
jgi:hypothetical protein